METYENTLKKLGKLKKLHTESMRKFALTLNYYSASAYKLVRKYYNNALPHPQTLCSLYG